MYDFTETSRSSTDTSLDDIRRVLEAERTDVCVCRQGEEIYSGWYSQKRELLSDSEEDYSSATNDEMPGTIPNEIKVVYYGVVHRYQPWDSCPSLTSKSNKRRKYRPEE